MFLFASRQIQTNGDLGLHQEGRGQTRSIIHNFSTFTLSDEFSLIVRP